MNEVDCIPGVHDLVARVHFRNEKDQNFLARRDERGFGKGV